MPKQTRKSSRRTARSDPLSPTSRPVEEQQTFDCTACMESITGTPIPIPSASGTEDDNICLECFDAGYRAAFEASVKSSTQYPVKIAGKEIEIKKYRKLFPKAFIDEYIQKGKEYAIAPHQRLYCASCEKFLGPRHTRASHCSSCNNAATCSRCMKLVLPGEADMHRYNRCKLPNREYGPFADLVKGKDYQRCPRCDISIQLSAACNHMTCSECKCSFCYICGDEAGEHSGHWDYGRPCPRFGQPASDRAIYDGTAPGVGPVEVALTPEVLAEREAARQALAFARHRIATLISAEEMEDLAGIVPLVDNEVTTQRRQERQELQAMLQEIQRTTNATRETGVHAPNWMVFAEGIIIHIMPLLSVRTLDQLAFEERDMPQVETWFQERLVLARTLRGGLIAVGRYNGEWPRLLEIYDALDDAVENAFNH